MTTSITMKQQERATLPKLKAKQCPRCGNTYTGFPALSRADNKTNICSDCGVEEAIGSLHVRVDGVSYSELMQTMRQKMR